MRRSRRPTRDRSKKRWPWWACPSATCCARSSCPGPRRCRSWRRPFARCRRRDARGRADHVAILRLVFGSSAKRHVAPVMFAVKAGVGWISLGHRAATECDAMLLGLLGQPGGGESINDGHSAPRSTRRAENRILALPTLLARPHPVTSASRDLLFGLCEGREQTLRHVQDAEMNARACRSGGSRVLKLSVD